MSYLYLKARTQKQTSLHQGSGCEKFHRSIWFVRWFFFKVILNYTWQCSQRCARCNFSPWKPQWSCLGGIRREWIWKLEDTTLFRGVTHCSGLCARHKAEHGSERKRDNGKTSKKHWKPLAQQIECFFQIGFIIKHQGSLCIEQRLVSKNNFLWSLIGNRGTKWTSENKSSSGDTLNLMIWSSIDGNWWSNLTLDTSMAWQWHSPGQFGVKDIADKSIIFGGMSCVPSQRRADQDWRIRSRKGLGWSMLMGGRWWF